MVPVVRIGGTVAALGVLLSLLVGVSRTAFAMAAEGDLPGWLAAVHHVRRVPHRAELVAGVLVTTLVLVTDLRGAIGFSSFAILTYYGIANAAAWTLPPSQPRRRHWTSAAGLAGCLLLAATLPGTSVAAGSGVFGAGALIWVARRRWVAGIPIDEG